MTKPTSAFARACLFALESDPSFRPALPLDPSRQFVWDPTAQDDAATAYEEYRSVSSRPMPWTDWLARHYPASWCGLPRSSSGNPTMESVREMWDWVPRRVARSPGLGLSAAALARAPRRYATIFAPPPCFASRGPHVLPPSAPLPPASTPSLP